MSAHPDQRLVLVLVVLWGAQLSAPVQAAETQGTESRIKVAYIFHLPKFIEWPGEKRLATTESIRICLLGADPIRATLAKLGGQKVEGRPILVTQLADARALAPCHLLFVGRAEEPRLPSILQPLQGKALLTVSDIPRFAHRGGMVGFVIERDRVRLEINPKTVRQAGMKASAKLLEIARIVR